MAKKIQLSIAEPCHENWDAMTPDAKGKFCGSCQKQVVDFSNMSDRQVAAFFKKPSTGSVCGRFMTDQLDRPMEIPRKRIPWLKYFFQVAIPAFLVSMKASAARTQGELTIKTVSADTSRPIRKTMGMVRRPPVITKDTILTPIQVKGKIAVKPPVVKEPEQPEMMLGGIGIYEPEVVQTDKTEIRGVVVDQQGDAVPFASITTDKKGNGTMADENGKFAIRKKQFGKNGSLTVSAAGFNSKIIINLQDITSKLTVQLESDVVLPEVTLIAMQTISCSRNVLMGAVSYVRGETIAVAVDSVAVDKNSLLTTANSLLVYPNPVIAGNSIHITVKNLEEGYHQLQVVSQSGQLVNRQELWIDGEATVLDVKLPRVSSGSYFMVLTDKKTGKKYTEKIIIQ